MFICGDHVCINKAEAEQYFEENLTIEVKIIEKKDKEKLDLIELNLKKDEEGNQEVKIYSKKETGKKLKILSNKEKAFIKEKIKKKKIRKIYQKKQKYGQHY